ncbi:hypothetical protein B0H14DRAFT_2589748 [Mycena olivaceomarginata]|nr:hypothetical protein B0H14DRAFT_2589748 [Mycena olivaceomarginata]
MAQTTRLAGKAEEVHTPRHGHRLRRKYFRNRQRLAFVGDHFERVIIVDPEIEDSEKPKTRILQYNAGHGARRLWPNFDSEMEAAGGRFGPADLGIHYSGVPVLAPYQDYPADRFPDTLIVRRSIGQKVLQRLLTQHSTSSKLVRIAGTVRGVHASKNKTSIDSVTVRQLDGSHLSLDNVALVIDCTGTTQAGFKWLKSAGFDLPESIRAHYNGNISYITFGFTVPSELASQAPHSTSSAKDYDDSIGRDLPRAAAEVIPFIAGFRGIKIPIPFWVTETIDLLCEHGDPSLDAIKIPAQSFVRYHTLPAGALPANFIALGDASLKLNPIHG